jgi:cytochrome c oxidase subunit 3
MVNELVYFLLKLCFLGHFSQHCFMPEILQCRGLGISITTLIWPNFSAVWPNAGPGGLVEKFETMGPWPIPTINTAILLTSGSYCNLGSSRPA